MTTPRCVRAATTYRVIRRTAGRHFYCTPIAEVRRIEGYVLGVVQREFNIELHTSTWMSNHHHTDLTDHDGELPRAMQLLHRETTMALKALHGIEGEVWDGDHYVALAVEDEDAMWHSVQYNPLNPVRAGLVSDYRLWPGLLSAPSSWLEPPEVFTRPTYYFNQRRRASVTLRFTPPPMFADRNLPQLVSDANTLIEEQQRAVVAAIQADGGKFLGLDRVLAQSPFDAPNTTASTAASPAASSLRFCARTREGQRNGWLKTAAHRTAYAECMRQLRAGADPRSLAWPVGTYQMIRLLNLSRTDD